MRTYCIAQGTLLSALWWPKWEGNPKKWTISFNTSSSKAATIYSFMLVQNLEPKPQMKFAFPSPSESVDLGPVPVDKKVCCPFPSGLRLLFHLEEHLNSLNWGHRVSWLFCSGGQSSPVCLIHSLIVPNLSYEHLTAACLKELARSFNVP